MKMTSIRVKIVRRLLLALSRLGIADRIAVNVKTWIGVRAFRVPVLQGLGIGNLGATEPWMMGIFNRLAPPRTGVFGRGREHRSNITEGQKLLARNSMGRLGTQPDLSPLPSKTN